MTTFLLIPGLVCDGHVWTATEAALKDQGLPVTVADVNTQDSITAMAQSLLDRHTGDLVPVGHSMGGRVAMEMARIAPERLQAVALLNTGMHTLKPGEVDKREAVIALANEKGMAALADAWLPGMMAEGITPDPAEMDGLRQMVLRMTPEIHERQIRALIARPDAGATIGQFTAPMLLITGRQDIFSPISQHEDIKALCPQAELHIIENAGHFAPVEQAAETASIIANWAQSLASQLKRKAS